MSNLDAKVYYILILWLLKQGFPYSPKVPHRRTRSGSHAVWEISTTVPSHLAKLDRVDLWPNFSAFVQSQNKVVGMKVMPFELYFSEDGKTINISVTR